MRKKRIVRCMEVCCFPWMWRMHCIRIIRRKMDITNHPVLGDGFCIKEACSQSYATDAKAIGILRQLCDQNKIAYQRFVNRSDVRGVVHWDRLHPRCFHLAQWILNSAFIDAFCTEPMGRTDFDALASAVTAYFS